MAIALVASTQTAGQNGNTSAGITTTGATLFVAKLSRNGFNAATLSDSKGNTWILIAEFYDTNNVKCGIYYCANPTTDAAQTFTVGGTSVSASLSVSAWSGTEIVSVLDTSAGANGGSSSTRQPGSVTPASNGSLIISAFAAEAASSLSIDSGFTKLEETAHNLPTNYGPTAIGYLIQGTAGAINPTWTLAAGAGYNVSSIAVFKPAAGGGGATLNDHNFRGSNRGQGLGMGRGMSFHQHPEISLEAYRREQSRKHREFMAKVTRRAA
jgi:hypothetical protein